MYISLVVWQTDEDPNLGKEWFHGSISREEVLDLLTHSEATGVYVHVHMYVDIATGCICVFLCQLFRR